MIACHGKVRGDFWGGWKEDAQNKFSEQGRNGKENEVVNWIKTIANYRKASSAISKGKMTQYVPQGSVYTYFRYDDKQSVMVIMNSGDSEKTIGLDRFIERTSGFSKAKNIVTGASQNLSGEWKIPGKAIWILELGK